MKKIISKLIVACYTVYDAISGFIYKRTWTVTQLLHSWYGEPVKGYRVCLRIEQIKQMGGWNKNDTRRISTRKTRPTSDRATG